MRRTGRLEERRQPGRNWRALLGLRRADALWLRARLPALLLLVTLGALFVWFLESPFFYIQRVTVQGAESKLAGQLVRVAGIGNQSIFAANPAILVTRMLTVPEVKSVRVQLELPHTAVVNVVLYQPVAVWVSGGKEYLVTQHGLVIREGDDPKLLHIYDATMHQYRHGEHIAATSVRTAYELRALLESQHIAIASLTFLSSRSLEMRSPAGWLAVFDVTGDMERQVEELATFLAMHQKFTLIDLRYGNVPYYRT